VRLIWPTVVVFLLSTFTFAQNQSAIQSAATQTKTAPEDKPKVFITDSQSWETRSSAGGSGGSWGAQSHGGARPQTAEIIKTFGERCPEVKVNNRPNLADYVVVLDHEGGKSVLAHRNKVAVFENQGGDAVMSHSTLSLGNSVKDACEEIVKHWAQNGAEIRAAVAKQNTALTPVIVAQAVSPSVPSVVPKVTVASTPEGADIEVDGSFVGNTPSSIEVASGEHQVVVKKSGYKEWTRKLKVSGGDIKLNAELEK
jgi:hypothetical protein